MDLRDKCGPQADGNRAVARQKIASQRLTGVGSPARSSARPSTHPGSDPDR